MLITVRRRLTQEEINTWRKQVIETTTKFFADKPDRQTCVVEIDPDGSTINVGRESIVTDVEAVHTDK